MSDGWMPEADDDRMAIADKLVNGLLQNNIPLENIMPGIFMAIEMLPSDEPGVE